MRIDGTVINERLKQAVIEAMATVNADLKAYRLNAEQAQKANLQACDDEQINGESVLVYKYKRAVYCPAVANLTNATAVMTAPKTATTKPKS